MPAEVRDKAFDAFFTTKHRGTGLGLPIARRVVEAHGGDIDISTPDGGGTVVSIRLPKSEVRSLKSEV
jgi:signal transduction histidine kinase